MQISPKGAAFIAAHEGIVTRAYRDVGGVWTIGIGHTAAAGAPKPVAGMTITRQRAFLILAADLARFEKRVAAALPRAAQHEFDGAVSFDFNTGAVDRAAWVKSFRANDRLAAANQLMRWVRAGGRAVAGLVRRRQDEVRLIFAGDYGKAVGALARGPDDGGEAFVPAIAPSVAQDQDSVTLLQRQLARLGFYAGAIDGIAGPRTRSAVKAYQKTHPDLVSDGIAGPATQAALARDIAVRERRIDIGMGGLAGLVMTWLAGLAGGVNLRLVAGGATALVLIAAAGVLAWRYRGEVARMFTKQTRKD